MNSRIIFGSFVYYLAVLMNIIISYFDNEIIKQDDLIAWCSVIGVINILFILFVFLENNGGLKELTFLSFCKIILSKKILLVNNLLLYASFIIFIIEKTNVSIFYFSISFLVSNIYILCCCFLLIKNAKNWKPYLYTAFILLWLVFMGLIIANNVTELNLNYYQGFNPFGGTFYAMFISDKVFFYVGLIHCVSIGIILFINRNKNYKFQPV